MTAHYMSKECIPYYVRDRQRRGHPEKRKRHKQHMKSVRAVPSLHRAVSGARSFPMKRAPAPQPAADANGGCGLHMQRHVTAANGWSPLVFELRTAVLIPGTRPKSRPEIKYITFPDRFNPEIRPKKQFSRPKHLFLQHVQVCCTSFVRRKTAGRRNPARPGPRLTSAIPSKFPRLQTAFSPSSANPPEDAVAFPHPTWYISLNQAEGDGQ